MMSCGANPAVYPDFVISLSVVSTQLHDNAIFSHTPPHHLVLHPLMGLFFKILQLKSYIFT